MIVAQIGCNEIRSDTVLYVFFAVYAHLTRSTYTTIQKFQVSSIFFFLWIKYFYSAACIKFKQSGSKDRYNVTRINFQINK